MPIRGGTGTVTMASPAADGSSMTERSEERPAPGLRRLAGGLAVAAGGWVALTALAALAIEPEAVVAIGVPTALMAADDGALVSTGPGWIATRPARPGAVRRLYAGGAWLVLPAPAMGCPGRP